MSGELPDPHAIAVQAAAPRPTATTISPIFPYVIGGLLHDVNNSLTALLMAAELGRSMSGAEIQELLQDLQFRARLLHVAEVVRLMQNLAREYYTPSPRKLEWRQAVAQLVDRAQSLTPGLKVVLAFDPRVEGSELPEALVLFLVGELLQNASRAGSAAPNPQLELKVTAAPEDNTVSVSCLDNGSGFPAAQLAAMRSGHIKPPGEGTQGGYGLYFVNEIAFRLQGRLLVENRAGGGARVEVLLPFRSPLRP